MGMIKYYQITSQPVNQAICIFIIIEILFCNPVSITIIIIIIIIIKVSDSFSIVLPIVNEGELHCAWPGDYHGVSHAFNFIPQRLHHSLTLPRSQFRDSATVTVTPRDGNTDNKLLSSA